jgi:sulfopyruvate decarboxylase subunit alpha
MRLDDKQRPIHDLKTDARTFATALTRHADWFSGVPDSVFRLVIPALPDWQFASRENHAVAMAFGARLGGRRPAVLMQNSGLGLSLDALLGTFSLHGQGLLLVISNRGTLGWEEIQHQDWGACTRALLGALQIPVHEFDGGGLTALSQAADQVESEQCVVALLLERGNLDE